MLSKEVNVELKDVVAKIHWLGHDAFKIKAEKVIYIDPWQLGGKPEPADIILVTHEHYDHFSEPDIQKISKPDTVVVTVAAAAKKLKGKVQVVKPGDKVTVQGIEIEAVPAYNTNKDFHPKRAGHVGFIVTVGGQRIYHAGDTDVIPEMSSFKVDIALLPVSGTYVMTAEEAVEAANRIKPKLVIPMHYGAIVGSASDAARFKQLYKGEVKILEPQTS
jgi:L-ascorbate metabolism protein UlaG (beta-lactamase superfamily)